MKVFQILSCALILAFITPAAAQNIHSTPSNNPAELGKVNWLRDYDKAIAKAEIENKPVFILFQEVPGCSTCSRFGFGPLSDPFIVEAIEENFIPLAIYNNNKGADAAILKKFNEPAWNNPVVRIIGTNERDLVKRMSNRWTPSHLLSTIIAGIASQGSDIPEYLSLRLEETEAQDNIKEANLAMYCFWTGEKEISKIDGVMSTEAGFMHGKEVVKVQYDAERVTLPEIVNEAAKASCADGVFVEDDYDLSEVKKNTAVKNVKKSGTYRKDGEVKYYLSKSAYKYIPMSALQQAKVNAAIGNNKNPDRYLSPRQLAVGKYIAKHKDQNWASQINQEMEATWYPMLDKVAMGIKS